MARMSAPTSLGAVSACLRDLSRSLGCTRIDAVGNLLARGIAAVARVLQPDERVDTESKAFLLTAEAVFEAPILRAIRHDFEVQTETVRLTIGFRFRLGVLAGAIIQRHCDTLPFLSRLGASLVRLSEMPPKVPPCGDIFLGKAS